MRKLLPPGAWRESAEVVSSHHAKVETSPRQAFFIPWKLQREESCLEWGIVLKILPPLIHKRVESGMWGRPVCPFLYVGGWKPSLFSAGKFPLCLWAEAYWCRTPLPTKPETIIKTEARGMFHPRSHSPLILLSLSYLSFFLPSFLLYLHFNS